MGSLSSNGADVQLESPTLSLTNASSSFYGSCASSGVKVNDAVYDLYTPAMGSVDLEIVLFHGFQSKNCKNAYVETWMRADGSGCSLYSLLSETFPRSRILSISYDSSTVVTATRGRMNMYGVGEYLATSIIELAEVGQICPVVLVGYCVGGLVLKEVCCRAEKLGTGGHDMNSYHNFLSHMKGAFFYSTCQKGTGILGAASTTRGPLLDYYDPESNERARLNSDFTKLRNRDQYGWKTWGVTEANETQYSKIVIPINSFASECHGNKPEGTLVNDEGSALVAGEGSARDDMDEFCVLSGEDHASICIPEDQNSSSFQFIKKFVLHIQDIKNLANQWRSSLKFPPRHQGNPGRVKKVIKKLQLDQPEPSGIYLLGMGGIGKSTLAKEVMVEIRSEFDVVCFIEDVKGRFNDHNLHNLIAADLYHGNGTQKVTMASGDEQGVWEILKGNKVLVVMDDVDSEEQVRTLLESNSLGRGSRLLITSRERPHKLAHSFVEYEVSPLSKKVSKRLFLDHLGVETIRKIPEKLIDEIVEKCSGLPLGLALTGSSLSSVENVSIWNETLVRLKTAEAFNGSMTDKLCSTLRASFDKLGLTEQSMFLDLALFEECEPKGFRYDLCIWKAAWNEGVPGSSVNLGFRNLESKFCVHTTRKHDEIPRMQPNESKVHYISASEEPLFISIHEQVRDMGRSICRQSRESIRLCSVPMGIYSVDDLIVEEQRRCYHAEVLSLTLDSPATSIDSRKLYRWHSIAQLQTLRLLRMSCVGLIGDGGAPRFPSKLTMLHMNTCFAEGGHSGSMENDSWPIRKGDVARLRTMTVLILEMCLSVRLPSNFRDLRKLKILIIKGEEFQEFPENVGWPESLSVLLLKRVGLSKVPDSLYLSSLERFTLKSCRVLTCLPEWPRQAPSYLQNFSPAKSKLNHLILEDLPVLTNLPVTLEYLGSLERLRIRKCILLSTLPETIGQLHSLKELDISGCIAISKLPDSFVKLVVLQRLVMHGCTKLSALPAKFGQLQALQELDLRRCIALEILPDTFRQLITLQVFLIQGCTKLSMLVKEFGELDGLQELDMGGCTALSKLPETFGSLKALQRLVIQRCTELPRDFGRLCVLKSLDMTGCSSLIMLPDSFGQLNALEMLNMTGCIALSKLPDTFGQLRSLARLDMTKCSAMTTLPQTFGDLCALKRLYMAHCTQLLTLSDNFGRLGALETLDMTKCEQLSRLPNSFGQLGALSALYMTRCFQLSKLPHTFGHLVALKTLDITKCTQLSMLSDNFGELRALKALDMKGCSALRILPPNFGKLCSLNTLVLTECTALSTIPQNFGKLSSLRKLRLTGCSALRTLPETFGQLCALKTLEMKKCTALSSLPLNFGTLTDLQYLNMTGCTALSKLPENFAELHALRTLNMNRCTALASLPENLIGLDDLKTLNISRCTAMRMLPTTFKPLRSLTLLIIIGCPTHTTLDRNVSALNELKMKGCKVVEREGII